MRNIFKNSWVFIIILFLTLILPFRVEAKQTNTYVHEYDFDDVELISGDSVSISNSIFYTPVEEQDFRLYDADKVTKFEYYIIDNIDSNGNIKYKKYDFSTLDKTAWNPKSSSFYSYSGAPHDYDFIDTVDYYTSCQKVSVLFDDDKFGLGNCNIILPAVNGKISRWRFDSKDYGDKKEISVCSDEVKYNTLFFSCDKAEGESEGTYVGKYEYYTSTVYKFYELPDEKPELKVSCDSNKLSAGETTKCKINFSYKYSLSNILFDITSDKLIFSNFQLNDYWNDFDDPWDASNYWAFNEIDNGYSINFAFKYLIYDVFDNNPLIATFKVTADEYVDDVVKSIEKSDIKYVEKTGDGIAKDEEPTVDDNTNNILNPSTFRNSYYLIIGIIIIGGICFIQLRSKKKSK